LNLEDSQEISEHTSADVLETHSTHIYEKMRTSTIQEKGCSLWLLNIKLDTSKKGTFIKAIQQIINNYLALPLKLEDINCMHQTWNI